MTLSVFVVCSLFISLCLSLSYVYLKIMPLSPPSASFCSSSSSSSLTSSPLSLSVCLYTGASMSNPPSSYPSIYPSIYLPIYLSIYVYIHPSLGYAPHRRRQTTRTLDFAMPGHPSQGPHFSRDGSSLLSECPFSSRFGGPYLLQGPS